MCDVSARICTRCTFVRMKITVQQGLFCQKPLFDCEGYKGYKQEHQLFILKSNFSRIATVYLLTSLKVCLALNDLRDWYNILHRREVKIYLIFRQRCNIIGWGFFLKGKYSTLPWNQSMQRQSIHFSWRTKNLHVVKCFLVMPSPRPFQGSKPGPLVFTFVNCFLMNI